MPVSGIIAISAGVAVLGTLGAGVSLGIATGKIAESISRNPESSSKIMSVALLFATMSEVTAIFSFVIAIMLVGKI